MELGNAGIDDSAYHRLRVRYCREFLETFSEVDWLMRGNFLQVEAEAHSPQMIPTFGFADRTQTPHSSKNTSSSPPMGTMK